MTHRVRTWPRLRFSLASLFLLTTLCAALLVAWKAITYEPPTHKISLYEKAPGTVRDSFVVGPNRVRMHLVTRNDRDGALHYENGRGAAVANLVAQNAQVLSSAAPWLDVVQIELSPAPDRLDVIEARVFDHKTRTLINDANPEFGWRMVAPDVLQIYGLGKPLPEKLDVWFRLHSYPAGDEVRTIAPTASSNCELSDGTKLTLSDIRPGLGGGWSSAKGFLSSTIADDGSIAAEFNITRPHASDERLQMAAVLKSGEKVHPELPHFIGSRAMSLESRQLIRFDAFLAELDHFEVRPFGGRERFFFEAVALPKVSTKPFVAAPIARVQIAGGEMDERIATFAPLDVSVATHRGEWAGGCRAGSGRASITKSANVTDVDKSFTFVSDCSGISIRPQLQFTLRNQTSPASNSGLTPSGFQGGTSGGNFGASCWTYRTPLDQVDAVEVELKP